ncbi:protein ALP1-like, partial [Aphis craccivora]
SQEPRRYWFHSAWNKRDNEREFQTVYKELIDDETKFHKYFRMSMHCFDVLFKKKIEMYLH